MSRPQHETELPDFIFFSSIFVSMGPSEVSRSSMSARKIYLVTSPKFELYGLRMACQNERRRQLLRASPSLPSSPSKSSNRTLTELVSCFTFSQVMSVDDGRFVLSPSIAWSIKTKLETRASTLDFPSHFLLPSIFISAHLRLPFPAQQRCNGFEMPDHRKLPLSCLCSRCKRV